MNPLVVFVLALSLVFGVSCDSGSQPPATPNLNSEDIAAQVGSKKILLSDIDAQIGPQLVQIEMERYKARKGKLGEIVSGILLEAEAKKRGVTLDQMFKEEITNKIEEPDDEAVNSFFERLSARGEQGTYEDLAPRIREVLYNNAENEQRTILLETLRKNADLKINIEPPRTPLDLSVGFDRGPEGAPIRFVEFSDYQCPYCARSQEIVEELLARYGSKIRHTFMDFPLEAIHPQARLAAVAARCASEQGKFWEYHEHLFAHQTEIGDAENFTVWAQDLGLDSKEFTSCIGDEKANEPVDRSLKTGADAGVTGTPAFFINGILISGAQPIPVFVEIIEEELARGTNSLPDAQ